MPTGTVTLLFTDICRAAAGKVMRKDAGVTSKPTNLFEDLLALVPSSLYDESGELFYSGRRAAPGARTLRCSGRLEALRHTPMYGA
jgi:hypothetical protein